MSKPFFKLIATILCVCLSFFGCASTSNNSYTEQQKQQMETSVIDGSYNNVFNATRTVFLNSGLVLQQVDVTSGFINGSISVADTQSKWRYAWFLLGLFGLLIFFATRRDAVQRDFRITATLVDLGNSSVEARLQTPLLERQSNQYGLALKRIFAEIKKQTMILEAAGRS